MRIRVTAENLRAPADRHPHQQQLGVVLSLISLDLLASANFRASTSLSTDSLFCFPMILKNACSQPPICSLRSRACLENGRYSIWITLSHLFFAIFAALSRILGIFNRRKLPMTPQISPRLRSIQSQDHLDVTPSLLRSHASFSSPIRSWDW